MYNVGTNYTAANWSEYHLGIWVRDNTPERSVFLTSPSIDAPTGFIGGRLRVSSYINWPYGHGIPLGDIFARDHDIDLAYNGTASDLASTVREFNVSYVYVGYEELSSYPLCITHFDSISWLTQVYADGNLRVYQVDIAEMPAS